MKKSILKYFKAFTLIGIMASVAVLSSCGEDDGASEPEATLTAYGVLSAESNLSKLKDEFDSYASIVSTLDDADADLTVFAPSNAAMSVLLGDLGLDDFSTVSESIALSVLNYHISQSGALATGDLPEGTTVLTAQGELITVKAGTKLETGASNDATITQSINATNGIVHIVDVVLVPPTIGDQIIATLGTVAQPLLLGADFSVLAQGITKADAAATDPTATIIAMLINKDAQLTVFAPTNATFEAAAGVEDGDSDEVIATKLQGFVDALSPASWNGIIRNHIVSAQGGDGTETIGSDDMITGFSPTSQAGIDLQFFFNTGAIPAKNGIGIYIDSNLDVNLADPSTYAGFNAEVALIDLGGLPGQKGNGRIHAIAGLLSPPTPD